MIQSVIFRLPGENSVFCLKEQGGKDRFIIQAFDKSIEPVVLNGSFEIIGKEEIISILDLWTLNACNSEEMDEAHFRKLVESAVDRIKEGVMQKVVLARARIIRSQTKISELFNDLLTIYPDAFVYAFNVGGRCMVGASPESLLRFNSGILRTEALGGTRTHGVFTEKEEIEHQQIVRYVENILKANNYKFSESERGIRQAGKVEHFHTGFTIESKGIKDDFRLANELHPTSAVCGLPYENALDYINSNEGIERKYYSGFLGPINSNGNFNMFVNLRCAEVYDGAFKLFAGAGINSMSNAEDELMETNNKMMTIGQCLK